MDKKFELLDLLMETELKYSEFINLLLASEEIDRALGDPIAIIAPAMTLGTLMGALMRATGVTVEEYNERARSLGKKEVKILDDLVPPKKEEHKSWPIL